MSQVNLSNEPHDLEWMMVDTRRRQSEAAIKLCNQANHWFLRLSGLGLVGRFVSTKLVTPVRAAVLRRRTLADLRQLDDRMLADIGIERADMSTMVNQLVSDGIKAETSVEPLAAQCPTTNDQVEVVAPVTSVEPKAAANSNAATHRAA